MKLSKYFIAVALSISYMYFLGAFYENSFSILEWSGFTKICVILFMQISNLMACVIANELK